MYFIETKKLEIAIMAIIDCLVGARNASGLKIIVTSKDTADEHIIKERTLAFLSMLTAPAGPAVEEGVSFITYDTESKKLTSYPEKPVKFT